MSLENALAFLKLAERDGSLRSEIARQKGRGAIEGLVALGSARGLSFCVEDYRKAVIASANGELDDAALLGVLEELGLADREPEGE